MARTNRDSGNSGIKIEPFDLPANDSYDQMAKQSIIDRYQYARFVYGCLFESSETGRTCFDPLLFHYPNLEKAYENIESSFMVGDVIKVSPVLEPLGDDVKLFRSWFPPGKWLDLDSMSALDISDDVGELVEFDAT